MNDSDARETTGSRCRGEQRAVGRAQAEKASHAVQRRFQTVLSWWFFVVVQSHLTLSGLQGSSSVIFICIIVYSNCFLFEGQKKPFKYKVLCYFLQRPQ